MSWVVVGGIRRAMSPRKLTHETYQRYLLHCRRSYRTLLGNAEAVYAAEKGDALTLTLMPMSFSLQAVHLVRAARPKSCSEDLVCEEPVPVSVSPDSSECDNVELAQFEWTSNLACFHAFGLRLRVLDNVNHLQFILDYRAVLQSNQETHRLGDSATSMYAYTTYL